MGRSASGVRHTAEPHSGDDGEQCAAQAVCKMWRGAYDATSHLRRELQPVPVPVPQPDFEFDGIYGLAALPGGERLCISTQGADGGVHVVDTQLQRVQKTR